MKRAIAMLTLLALTGCSTSNVYVVPPAGTGQIHITVNQGRKGLDSLVPLDGVQANIPMQGGTVTAPANAPVINKTKE